MKRGLTIISRRKGDLVSIQHISRTFVATFKQDKKGKGRQHLFSKMEETKFSCCFSYTHTCTKVMPRILCLVRMYKWHIKKEDGDAEKDKVKN